VSSLPGERWTLVAEDLAGEEKGGKEGGPGTIETLNKKKKGPTFDPLAAPSPGERKEEGEERMGKRTRSTLRDREKKISSTLSIHEVEIKKKEEGGPTSFLPPGSREREKKKDRLAVLSFPRPGTGGEKGMKLQFYHYLAEREGEGSLLQPCRDPFVPTTKRRGRKFRDRCSPGRGEEKKRPVARFGECERGSHPASGREGALPGEGGE